MVRILFLNPNKWGRGITPIWIPSHAAVLKSKKHEVRLFDATFYKNWTDDEISYNTNNLQYKPTNYNEYVEFNEMVFTVQTVENNRIGKVKIHTDM